MGRVCRFALPLAAFAVTSALVLRRIADDGPALYGMGAEYIEHGARLAVLRSWRSFGGELLEFPAVVDGGYPPLLHLVTVALGGLIGHGVETATATMLLWVALLGLACGSIARSVSEDRRASSLAAALAVVLPAVAAVAARYYYDLPMTALLYGGLAAQLHAGRSQSGGGALLAGIAYGAACLTKWSALPLVAVFLVAGSGARGRGRALASGAVAVVLVVGFLAAADPGGSFRQMAGGMLPGSDRSPDHPVAIMLRDLLDEPYASGLARPFSQVRIWDAPFLLFYPVSLVTAVLSPLGALLLGPLAIRSLIRTPPARRPGIVVLIGVPLFLALWVHVQDERMLLPAAPMFCVLAGIGLGSAERFRRVLTGVVLIAHSLVIADFHVGGPSLLTAERDVLRVLYRGVSVRARGFGLASSQDGIGWRRRDEQPPHRRDYREAVWGAVQAERPVSVGSVPGAPMFGDEGDGAWLRWRALHAELVDGVAVPSVREARGGAEDPELLLLRAGTPLPAALTVGTYVSHREVPAEDRGRAVLLLRRVR